MSEQVTFQSSGGVAGDTPRCIVEGVLDFNNARVIMSGVSQHIENHATLVIDLSSVSKSNSAGLALMIEWLAHARRLDHNVTFHHIPDGLCQLAGVCQVEGLI